MKLPNLAEMLGEAGEAKHFSIGRVTPLVGWWRRALAAEPGPAVGCPA